MILAFSYHICECDRTPFRCAIAITFLVINLSTLLKEAFSLCLYFFGEKTVLAVYLIIAAYAWMNDDNFLLLSAFFE